MTTPETDTTKAGIQVKHLDWIVTTLPFAPAAISDANLIVGQFTTRRIGVVKSRTSAVQFQNGTLQELPFIVSDGGWSAAVDVSSLGAIVGKTANLQQQPAVVWFPLPLALPEAPIGVFVPAAINKNVNVVGSSLDAQVAFKWHDPFGYQGLIAPLDLQHRPTFATDINDNGYTAGFAETQSEAFPVVWNPQNIALAHYDADPARQRRFWPGVIARSHPHINTHGDVALLSSGPFVTVLHLNNTFDVIPSIPDPVSVDGINDQGRLIGTSRVDGALRGWTFYQNNLVWLSPPPGADASAFVQPTGVNTCGNIVGQVLNQSLGFISGVVYTKELLLDCDGGGITHK
jgi:hypothetical protein